MDQVLKSTGELCYYTSAAKKKKPRTALTLDATCRTELHTQKRPRCWRIYGPHGMLKLQAPSGKEFIGWLEAVRAHTLRERVIQRTDDDMEQHALA